MISRRLALGLVLVCASGALPAAQIFFSDTVVITFESAKVPAEAAWSDQMELTPHGLETRQPWAPNTSRDFWLRTQPIATGPSWRPPTNLGLTLKLVGVETAGGPSDAYVRAYVRYSADRVHWSSWVVMSPNMNALPLRTEFEVQLMLPGAARARFGDLMRQWQRTNPVWSSDEHEFCVWLATHHRDLFAEEVPLIGYAQVLLEGGAQGLRLRGLSITHGSSSGGLHMAPRGEQRKTAEQPWFFDLSKIR